MGILAGGAIMIAGYLFVVSLLLLYRAERMIDRDNLKKKIVGTIEEEAREIAEWVISLYDPKLSHPEWRKHFREVEDRITAAIQHARKEELKKVLEMVRQSREDVPTLDVFEAAAKRLRRDLGNKDGDPQ